MVDQELALRVARRWKKASGTDWASFSDAMDSGEAKDALKDMVRAVRGYVAKCKYLQPIFKALAEPLMTPKIGIYADRMDQRVLDLGELLGIIQAGVALAKKADDEWETLLRSIADGTATHRTGTLEAVQDLPSVDQIYKLSQQAGKFHEKLIDEDEDYHIDWELSDYIGSEAGVSKKIERASADMSGFTTDIPGASILYGLNNWYTDTDRIEDQIDEYRSELEEGEE